MEIIITTLVLIATFLASFFAFFKWIYKHWERKNIAFDEPTIPFGSYPINPKESLGPQCRQQYEIAKAAGFKEYGVFVLWRPIYFPIDPQLIKNILSVDFHAFANRGLYYNKESDPLSAHLFALNAHEWKTLRAKLTPTFTSGKMKMMIHTVAQCGEELNKAMDQLTSLDEPINIRDILSQFTTDVIGSVAFGIDCNSFENPNSEFLKYSKLVFQESTLKRMKDFWSFCFPKFSRKIGLNVTYSSVAEFFLRIVRETVEYREKNNIVRNDFMQLLLNLKNDPSNHGPHLTLEEIAAQAFIFFIAGFETSSTTMTFFLYELCQNPEIQDKVRAEINEVLEKHDGKVTYDAVMDMKYMKQTMDETLRKYPPAPVLFRQSVEDYKLQGSGEILEKGTAVFISAIGLHYDPEYFPDPEKFDPDRFNDVNRPKINPYTYLPFGEGPRNCIGLRFGIMQSKVGLIYMLKNYKFSLNQKTQSPLLMDPASFILLPLGGVWLNASKVE